MNKIFQYMVAGSLLIIAVVLLNPVEAVPLGLRTNNPGNIIKTSIQWRGEIECKSRFECFSTPEMGIRALAKNLLSYQNKYKLDTIPKIIRRWSPPNENNTRLLSNAMCSRLNTICGSIYSLGDGDNLKNLIIAIVIQENGYNPYSNKMIQEILDVITNTNGSSNHVSGSRSRWLDENVGNESGDRGKEERVLVQDEPVKGEELSGRTRDKEREDAVDKASDSSYFSILSDFITKVGCYICTRHRGGCGLDTVEPSVPVL